MRAMSLTLILSSGCTLHVIPQDTARYNAFVDACYAREGQKLTECQMRACELGAAKCSYAGRSW